MADNEHKFTTVNLCYTGMLVCMLVERVRGVGVFIEHKAQHVSEYSYGATYRTCV